MLTSDPIYMRPLLPKITILNTSASSTIYTYNPFTGTATGSGLTNVFPIYCTLSLSQNTHATFTIQFEDSANVMEAANVTVNSRVWIECSKQNSGLTWMFAGLVRQKGYSRGGNNKINYTISGSGLSIRFNERVLYSVSEAARTATGAIDLTDATRKADTLLQTNLDPIYNSILFSESQVISITSLATNSPIETFIPNLSIEYGEVQDLINYIQEQTGGEVVVDTSGVVGLRGEISLANGGRGFTLKNSNSGSATDDADDTMYLIDKQWDYQDSFYKSDAYANRLYAILPADAGVTDDIVWNGMIGYTGSSLSNGEIAIKFRPSHSHYRPGDFYLKSAIFTTPPEPTVRFRVVGPDTANTPNSLPVVANVDFPGSQMTNTKGSPEVSISWNNNCQYVTTGGAALQSFDLDTTKDYWFLISNDNLTTNNAGPYHMWLGYTAVPVATQQIIHTAALNASSNSSAGTGWVFGGFSSSLFFAQPRTRSHSFIMHDPKAIQKTQSGITAGLPVDSILSDVSPQVTTRDGLARYMANQLYMTARPRTTYNFPKVTCPNIPPMPGDVIIVSDAVLGLSASGSQIVQTVCGDMTYTWGEMDRGNYQAPTIISLSCVGVHSRYK